MNIPREPFDTEEARLARVYRALPQGEPAPALDTRILANARAAVASRPRGKRRPWFLGAGLGTAAAAVFAAGIAWQLGIFEPRRALESLPAQVPAAQEALERIDIEFVKKEKRDAPPPAKPEVTGGLAGEKKLRDEPDAFRTQAAAPAAPPPAPRDGHGQASATEAAAPTQGISPALQLRPKPAARDDAMPAPAASSIPISASAHDLRDHESAANGRDVMSPEAVSTEPTAGAEAQSEHRRTDVLEQAPMASGPGLQQPAAAAGATRAPSGRASNPTADSARNVGRAREKAPAVPYSGGFARDPDDTADQADDERSIRLAKQAGLPPWAEDIALLPEAWLERIRDRVQAGDRQGAEHSLRRFVLAHPAQRVPRDLQRLLAE